MNTSAGINCLHTTIEVKEISTDIPISASSGDVSYMTETHLIGICMTCGAVFDNIPEFEEMAEMEMRQ
jgi:hypothetical protein